MNANPAEEALAGTDTVAIGPADLDLAEGTNTVVYAWGSADDKNLQLKTQSLTGMHSAPGGVPAGETGAAEAATHNESIPLGSTVYGRRWWGTRVNAETKLLLLTHCFETCRYGRVKIQTDARNTRSQAAIARLGAQREGVLRGSTRRWVVDEG